jgi:hypothetical protein
MKTYKLFGILMLLASFAFSQQVPRNKVVVEIGTGTWCYYCPGAAMGADDLVANGKEVAIVEYHGGGVDPFINEYSSARISYYGVTGYPTAYFDGGNAVVGGNHTNSMYTTYLQKYNQRIAVPSSFSIDMTGSKVGPNDYQVVVTIDKVDATNYDNLVMHFVVTESEIPYNWQGMAEVNFVERLMIPNQSGADLDFSTTNSNQVFALFSLDPAWNTEHCEIVVFVQNPATKEIYQGALRDLTEFDITNNIDAAIVNTSVPQTICQDVITPKIKLGNFGLDNLTSVDVKVQVNNEPETTFNWSGNLVYSQSTIVQLPEVTFTPLEVNNILIWVENPNGQPDQFTANDVKLLNLSDAPPVVSPVSLALKLDDNPDETTWTLLNSDGISLYSGGPYTQPNQFIVQSFVLNEIDCYTFIISDAGGDGLTGQGMYKLAHQGSTIFAEGKDFGFEEQVQFGIGLTGMDEMTTGYEFSITPNPIKDNASIAFNLNNNSFVHLSVYNSTGEKVFETEEKEFSAGSHTILFENSNLSTGIYYFNLTLDGNLTTQKAVITK